MKGTVRSKLANIVQRRCLGFALGGLLFVGARNVCSQEAEHDEKPLSSAQIKQTAAAAANLLSTIHPNPTSPDLAYVHTPDVPCKTLEVGSAGDAWDGPLLHKEVGAVRWGRLFSPDEIVALVNLPPDPEAEDEARAPRYLCFFAWDEDHWTFRQFLGNAYRLEIHRRRDQPATFLQGSYGSTEYDGEHLSWYYNPTTKRLVNPRFASPFYLAGNYLVRTPDFLKHPHGETRWIYQYKDGKRGPLVAAVNDKAPDYFTVGFREKKSGRMKRWFFKPDGENQTRYFVYVSDDPEGENVDASLGDDAINPVATLTVPASEELTSEYCFQLLTGLSPDLLHERWLDEVPKSDPPKPIHLKVRGVASAVAAFHQAKR